MRRSHLIGLLASASALALAAPAFAADASGDKPSTTVQEVVVTAEKKPEAQKDVPMSISALPQAQLEKLNAVDFSDYTKLVPGLSLESDSPGEVRLTLRGLNAGGVASTVAVYVDETPVGSSSGLVDGAIVAANYDPFDMNRIEVLRGPQGTLYGSNTEGGLLKFVTNAPEFGKYAAQIDAGFEGVDHGDTGWDVKGMVNIPLGDTLALRIDAYHDQMPGWINNVLLNQSDVNKGTKDGGRVELEWKPIDKFNVRLTAFAQNMKFGGITGEDVNVGGGETPTFGLFDTISYVPSPTTFEYRNYNATVHWDMDFANLTSSTSYGTVNNRLVSDFTNAQVSGTLTYGEYIDLLVDPLFGVTPPTALPFTNEVDDSKFTEEVRLQSPKSDNGLEWLAGAYYTYERGLLNQHLRTSEIGSDKPITAIPDLEDPMLSSVYKEWAGFGDLTYHITSKWDIEAGARYSDQTQSAHETITGLLVPGGLDISMPSQNDVSTWSLGSKYKVSDNTMLYARFATGYRPGGPNVVPPCTVSCPAPSYQPDSNKSYEAGIKTSFDDGKVRLDAAVFYIDWDHIQVFLVSHGYGIDGNGGQAQSEGFEWDWTWVPIQGLTLSWNGADTNAALTTDAPGIFGKKGDSLPMVPKWQSALDGEYDWEAWSGGTAFVGATLAYQSSESSDFDSQGGARTRLPGYETIDLRAGVEVDRTRFEIWAKNVQNTKGYTAYGGEESATGFTSVGLIQPATYGITISKKF